MTEPREGTELQFHEVTPERWHDVETLFASRGGPSHGWCMAWRALPSDRRADSAAKRQAMQNLIQGGQPVGLLGYRGAEPVAWCSVAPRESYRPLGGLGDDETTVWARVCLFMKREHRGLGLGKDLLRAAIRHARLRGADVLEADPVDPESPSGFKAVGRAGRRRPRPLRRRVWRPRLAPDGGRRVGLNYSYRLFFPRDRLWPVLRALAGFACAPPAEEWIVLERADGSRLRLPFTSSYDASGAHRSWARRSEPIQLNATVRKLQFNASLFFAADAAIAPYVQSLRDDWCDTVPSEAGDEPDSLPIRDAQGRYAIGWIDLLVLLHPGGEGGIPAGADRIAFEFVAVTTAMSLLFAQSTAIRSTFVRLLEEHAGLCGLFDDEVLPGQAQPFWPPGRAG